VDAIGLLADTDLDRVLDLDGFNADEEAILRKSYWLIRENWDLAEWAVCQTASNGLASAVQVARLFQIAFPRRDDPVRIRGVGRGGNGVFGGCDTGLLVPWVMSAWIPALANAAQLMESIHTPGTQVASASEGQWHILVCLAPGGSFMRFVNNWSAGGVAVRLCMELYVATILLHEFTHVALVAGSDQPATGCPRAPQLENLFRWAMLQRYQQVRVAACCASGTPLADDALAWTGRNVPHPGTC